MRGIRVASWIALAVISAGITANAQDLLNAVEVTVTVAYRYLTSNGIPDHPIGEFPNRNNPNTIAPQRYTFRIPMNPKPAASPIPVARRLFGVALNGVPFDPGTAEFWRGDPRSGWNYEALSGRINLGLDDNNGHVQPTGAYHYHGLPTGLIANRQNDSKMILIGFAADGYPVYANYGHDDPKDPESALRSMRSSYRLREGVRPGGPRGRYDGTFVQDYVYDNASGDLDECNGRYGVTPEYPNGTYHYYVTNTYPFIPRLFHGMPDDSFMHRGFARGQTLRTRPGGRPPGPPPPPGRRPPPPPKL